MCRVITDRRTVLHHQGYKRLVLTDRLIGLLYTKLRPVNSEKLVRIIFINSHTPALLPPCPLLSGLIINIKPELRLRGNRSENARNGKVAIIILSEVTDYLTVSQRHLKTDGCIKHATHAQI